MERWKVKTSKTLLETPYFNVVQDKCVDFSGEDRDYYRLSGGNSGYVMVVPIKLDERGNATYVMIEQYRHGAGGFSLEFPAGGRKPGESSADAAARELKEETGYTAKQMKFIYSTYLSPVRSADQQSVFLAVVEDEPGETAFEAPEIGSGMKVVELSSEQLHKEILENGVQSACSLAALCVVLLKSQAALKYLNSPQDTEEV